MNLGKRLAENLEREKQDTEKREREREAQRAREEQRANEVATRFFDEARQFFTAAILAGRPSQETYVQVGGPDIEANPYEEFERLLQGYRATGEGPDSLFNPEQLDAHWKAFREWAASEGLHASWEHCHDGVGVYSWWRLRVQPWLGRESE
jgi:hypothetical protein